jgi:hypothetical protein
MIPHPCAILIRDHVLYSLLRFDNGVQGLVVKSNSSVSNSKLAFRTDLKRHLLSSFTLKYNYISRYSEDTGRFERIDCLSSNLNTNDWCVEVEYHQTFGQQSSVQTTIRISCLVSSE